MEFLKLFLNPWMIINLKKFLQSISDACMSIKELYEMQARVCGYRQRVLTAPAWLLLTLGRVGDWLRWMGVKTQVSTINIKQLLVRECYDSSHAVSDLEMPQTSIEVAIKEFYEWRKNSQ